jgi:hypothetical protein
MKEFIDAVQKNKKHPDTFKIPSKENLDKMEEGFHVKVGHNGERFWAIVSSIEESGTIFGVVDNDLVNDQPFKYGDKIMFERRHILDIIDFRNP